MENFVDFIDLTVYSFLTETLQIKIGLDQKKGNLVPKTWVTIKNTIK